MSREYSPTAYPGHTTWHVVAGGIIALAVAMGIGRFAFTPLMPRELQRVTPLSIEPPLKAKRSQGERSLWRSPAIVSANSVSRSIASTTCLEQKPGAPLGFIDQSLEQACRRDVAMLVA